jgi:excisionase family DNA binding protein
MCRGVGKAGAVTIEDLIRAVVREELAKAKPANDSNEHLTVATYAARLSISERTVRDAIRESRLEHVRIGRSVRIPAGAKIERKVDEATKRARLALLGSVRR